MIETVDDANFLEATASGYTFVDFWAPWCAPCRRLEPTYLEAAESFGDRLRFAKCNVDEAIETAELLQVTTIPTIVLFDPEGNEVGRVVNPPPGALTEMVEEVVRSKRL